MARSQVAGGGPNDRYLKRERKRLEQSGVSAEAIDRIINDNKVDALFPPGTMPVVEWVTDYLLPFFEALRVSRGLTALDNEEEQEVARARQKMCLREFARRFGKIVDRWERLDPLSFDDAQLEEASRAHLYGFYRSSVVLSAAALESHLKRALDDDQQRKYTQLVEDAAASLGMDMVWIDHAKRVFYLRNDVVHGGYEPKTDESEEALYKCRDVLTRMRSPEASA